MANDRSETKKIDYKLQSAAVVIEYGTVKSMDTCSNGKECRLHRCRRRLFLASLQKNILALVRVVLVLFFSGEIDLMNNYSYITE